jgi:excisionase family DNA binding protein
MSEMLDVDQVADILGCSVDKATEELNHGNLPGVKFGRSWRVPKVALEQRLVEIALQQAAERRAKPVPSTLDVVLSVQRGRSPRMPPVLPNTGNERPSGSAR